MPGTKSKTAAPLKTLDPLVVQEAAELHQ
jgi:hypothetical protein